MLEFYRVFQCYYMDSFLLVYFINNGRKRRSLPVPVAPVNKTIPFFLFAHLKKYRGKLNSWMRRYFHLELPHNHRVIPTLREDIDAKARFLRNPIKIDHKSHVQSGVVSAGLVLAAGSWQYSQYDREECLERGSKKHSLSSPKDST